MMVLTPDRVGALLDPALERFGQVIFDLAAAAGMRAGELLGIKWGDVDLAAGRLTFHRQNAAGLLLVTPKSG